MKPYSSQALIGAIAGLALIGGLAAACFTKAFGIVFLGEPRSKDAENAHESSTWMTIPMMILAAACIAIGLLGAAVIQVISPVIAVVLGNPHTGEIRIAANYLLYVTAGSTVFIVCLVAIAGLRSILISRHSVGKSVTWDCGYAAPTPRMQYTASSFAQPVIDLFQFFLRTKKNTTISDSYFPAAANFETHTLDTSRESIYKPLYKVIGRFFQRMQVVQEGRIHIYVLYIVFTLLILLFWNMR
jgi:NADH:ubiquinone oxidoreductase subunit 5 (subunit L)/multisubunit Na+/H+ antiporter MnhA subunit